MRELPYCPHRSESTARTTVRIGCAMRQAQALARSRVATIFARRSLERRRAQHPSGGKTTAWLLRPPRSHQLRGVSRDTTAVTRGALLPTKAASIITVLAFESLPAFPALLSSPESCSGARFFAFYKKSGAGAGRFSLIALGGEFLRGRGVLKRAWPIGQ
jgi:hypothetical protein